MTLRNDTSRLFSGLLLLALPGLAACGDEEVLLPCGLGSTCGCPEERFVRPGACCPPWTRAEQDGTCRARDFTLPSAADGFGGENVYLPRLVVDARGLSLIGFSHVPPGYFPRTVLAEELSPGRFWVREPAGDLDGGGDIVGVAADPRTAHAVVVWRQGRPGGTAILKSERLSDGSWLDPKSLDDRLSSREEYATRPHVVMGGSGETLVTWDQWTGQNFGVQLARKLSEADPWELPRATDDIHSPKVFYSNEPHLALNTAGDAVVSWFQSNGGPLMTYAATREGTTGELSIAHQEDFLSPPGAPVDQHQRWNPYPALSEAGDIAITWAQEDGRGATPIYLATRAPGGDWQSPPVLSDSLSPASGIGRCATPHFGPDGDLYVVWFQFEGAESGVYLAHRAPDGSWPLPGSSPLRLSAEGRYAMNPTLALGRAGGGVVTWTESDGTTFRVVARTFDGMDALGETTQLSPEGAGDAWDPVVAVGPKDRTVVAWSQGKFGKERLFVARME
jgi:hypothetical protein